MNELISTRIRDHATRLVLPHLAENLDGLLARAQSDSMGGIILTSNKAFSE